MKSKYIGFIPYLCIVMAFMTAVGYPQEQSIQKKDVPRRVLDVFHKSYPNVTAKGYSKEVEHDTLTYEIESVEGKVHRDVTYLADGTLVSVEESIPFADLPEPVRNALGTKYPRAKVSPCEKIMKGATTQYEVLVTSDSEKVEIVFDADGTVLEKEKK